MKFVKVHVIKTAVKLTPFLILFSMFLKALIVYAILNYF